MKTMPFLLRDELRFSPNPPPIYLSQDRPAKVRVALFGSFHGGYHVLKELLSGELADRVTVVGVATDDPTQPFIHAEKRLWRYPHLPEEETMTPRFAREHGLAVFTGRVKTPEFFGMFMDEWQPQLCLMATFGQKIPTALIHFPTLGFYNFHHSAGHWPSYPGPDPIAAMVRDGRSHLVLTIHKVSDVIDGGEFVARSHPVAIPDGINAVGMHRITWPQMGPFIRREVGTLLGTAAPYPLPDQALLLHEMPIAYDAVSRRSVVGQIQPAFAARPSSSAPLSIPVLDQATLLGAAKWRMT